MHRRKLICYAGAGLAGLSAMTGRWSRALAAGEAQLGKQGPAPAVTLKPTRLFLTTGLGIHERDIQANDRALVDAGIGNFNRDRVSSIVPPNCKVVSREEGVKMLPGEGEILFAVVPLVTSNVPGTKVVSAMGLAVPEDGGTGTIAEVDDEGPEAADAEAAARKAVEMAMGMFAFRIGSDFDPVKEFRPGKQVYQIGNRMVRVHSAGKGATVGPAGKYTSVVASVVYLF
jgi:arginine decarboxylase